MGEAATVTACTPSPEGAVRAKFQVLFGVVVNCFAVNAPVTWTHCVSELVTTVSVSPAPCLAYSVPPTLTVPAFPLKTAEDTDEAKARLVVNPPMTTAATVAPIRTAERRVRMDDSRVGNGIERPERPL